MATFKEIYKEDQYRDDSAIPNLIRYISRHDHAISRYIGAVGVDLEHAADQMIWTSKHFNKNSGKRLRHFVLAFDGNHSEDLVTIFSIGERIAEKIAKRYQVAFAIHENTENLHIHFVLNAVSYIDGKRYRGTHEEYKDILKKCNKAVSNAGLGCVMPVKKERT